MMSFIRKFAAAAGVIASAAVFSSPAAADGPEMLQPASGWNINYGPSNCRLSRIFGEGEDQVVLTLDRFGPSDDFQMIVAGRPLRRLLSRTPSMDIGIRFGPHEEEEESNAFAGALESFDPAIIVSSASIASLPQEAEGLEWDDPVRYDPKNAGGRISPEQEARTEWVSLSNRGRTFTLPPGQWPSLWPQCASVQTT